MKPAAKVFISEPFVIHGDQQIAGVELRPFGGRIGSHAFDARQAAFARFELDAYIDGAGLQLNVDGESCLFQVPVVVEFRDGSARRLR